MDSSHILKEKKKSEIISYLTKHPFATTREIADGYASTMRNQNVIKNLVGELIKEGKVGFLPTVKSSYFMMPNSDGIDNNYLVWTMNNSKILLPRFRKIKYHYYRAKTPTIPQLLENLISIFHLQLKIFLRRHKISNTKKSGPLRKPPKSSQFYSNFLEGLARIDFDWDISSEDELLWSYNIGFEHEYDYGQYEFNGLRSNRLPLSELLKLMEIKETNDSYRAAADEHKTTIKNVRKLLKSITDEQGRFSIKKLESHREYPFDPFSSKIEPEIYQMVVKSKLNEVSRIDNPERRRKTRILNRKLKINEPTYTDLRNILKV